MGDAMDAAIATEKHIKKWQRDWKKNLIERDNPKWDDLVVALGFDSFALIPRWTPEQVRGDGSGRGGDITKSVMPDPFRHPPIRKLSSLRIRGTVPPPANRK
jgi:hypothetical protein